MGKCEKFEVNFLSQKVDHREKVNIILKLKHFLQRLGYIIT